MTIDNDFGSEYVLWKPLTKNIDRSLEFKPFTFCSNNQVGT